MPTSNAQALLELSDPALQATGPRVPDMWTESAQWQDITNHEAPPWRWERAGLVVGIAAATSAFANKYWATGKNQRDDFMKGNGHDNDSEGRDALNQWVKKRWPAFRIKEAVLEELQEGNADPWSYMESRNTDKVSD